MPGSVALFLWCLGTLFELCFVVCSLVRKSFVRYFFLNLYFILSVLASTARFLTLSSYGSSSEQYIYAYFYTDALLTLGLFVALISLYSLVFGELGFSKQIRFGAVLLLLGTAAFSYGVVRQSEERLATSFAYELSQNLYFVGLVLTYILWGAVLKLREARTRLVQFILALGLYFSAYAASYALLNLADKFGVVRYLSQLLACLLPLSWSITMLRHTEDSRIATAPLVAVQR
jgi:hypothetical protein